MQVTSSAFETHHPIPRKYSAEGDNLSPELEWRSAPASARSFAVLCEDPDAPHGTFHHWAVWDIPADWRRLEEGAAARGEAGPFRQAINDFGQPGYGGPLPPPGDRPHHYHFRVVALARDHLDLPPRPRIGEVVRAVRDWALDEGEVVGLYRR